MLCVCAACSALGLGLTPIWKVGRYSFQSPPTSHPSAPCTRPHPALLLLLLLQPDDAVGVRAGRRPLRLGPRAHSALWGLWLDRAHQPPAVRAAAQPGMFACLHACLPARPPASCTPAWLPHNRLSCNTLMQHSQQSPGDHAALCPLCPLCSDPLTGRKSGVAYLEFSAASEAQNALKLNGGCGAVARWRRWRGATSERCCVRKHWQRWGRYQCRASTSPTTPALPPSVRPSPPPPLQALRCCSAACRSCPATRLRPVTPRPACAGRQRWRQSTAALRPRPALRFCRSVQVGRAACVSVYVVNLSPKRMLIDLHNAAPSRCCSTVLVAPLQPRRCR